MEAFFITIVHFLHVTKIKTVGGLPKTRAPIESNAHFLRVTSKKVLGN